MATLTGTASNDTLTGTNDDDLLLGLGGIDSLIGGGGNDTLDGGSSDDTLVGGLGDDVYYIDHENDRIIESAGEGFDIAYTSTDYMISHSVSLEVLSAANITTTISVTLQGNAFANRIIGSKNNDVLSSGGGGDTILAGDGNDSINAMGTTSIDGGDGIDRISVYLNQETVARSIDFGTGITSNFFALIGSYVINTEDIQIVVGSGNDTVWGSAFKDEIIGGEGDDYLVGAGSNDGLYGGIGNDTLLGGIGNDEVNGGDGNDVVFGGDGDDRLAAETGTNQIYGGAGNDFILAGTSDYIDGGDGTDTVSVSFEWQITARTLDFRGGLLGAVFASTGSYVNNVEAITLVLGSGNDRVFGGAFNDTLQGDFGNDFLSGEDGNDSLLGSEGNDLLFGQGGNDTLDAGSGNDQIYGGAGNDYIIAGTNGFIDGGSGTDTVYISLAADTVGRSLDFGSSITGTVFAGTGNYVTNAEAIGIGLGSGSDTVWGTTFNDSLFGASGNDLLFSGQGDDTLFGGNNNDYLAGDAGNDSLDGQNGDDILLGGDGIDTLLGGSGLDTLNGGTGADSLVGGDGSDFYFVDNSGDIVVETTGGGTDWVIASSNWSAASGSAIEIIFAFDQSSTTGLSLGGSGGFSNQIYGTAGNDTIGTGVDTGGLNFADRLYGYGGNDIYNVDELGASVYEQAGGGTDTINASVNFTLHAGSQVEVINSTRTNAASNIVIFGNELNNQINGNELIDSFVGGDGNDSLNGFGGADFLQGQAGDDVISGGDANDIIIGGTGRDTMTGGAGADTFRFAGASDSPANAQDLITDFVSGVDKLDFTNTFNPGFNWPGAFTIGTLQAGSGPRLEIIAGTSGADHRVLGDVNNDGVADFELLITNSGTNAPVAGDFIL
jgi:trimeric autotransporter adhesin